MANNKNTSITLTQSHKENTMQTQSMNQYLRHSSFGDIHIGTILFDKWWRRRVQVIWADDVVERGWLQPNVLRGRSPNYLQVKVLSIDEDVHPDANPFVDDWKIARYEDPDGIPHFRRIQTEEDWGEDTWEHLIVASGRVQDGDDFFVSGIDVIHPS